MLCFTRPRYQVSVFMIIGPLVTFATLLCYSLGIPYEPRSEKTVLRGFRPGPTQTRLYNHTRWLEA